MKRLLSRGRPYETFSVLKSCVNDKSCGRPLVMVSRYQNTSSTMEPGEMVKAAFCTDFKKPLIVQPKSFDKHLKDNQVCIDVRYAAINYADILVCKGLYQAKAEPPFCPGVELSGIISSVGEKVESVKPGDHVVAVTLDSMGAYAEKCVTYAYNVWPIPKSLALQTAACIPTSYGTMMLALERRARIKSSDTVLIMAATGALGIASADISKCYGAKVIAACSSSEKQKILLDRGVSATINYKTENLREQVKKITGGKGVDVIIDSVGGQHTLDLVKCLSPEGRIIVLGFTSGTIPEVASNICLLKNCDLIGVWWGQYYQYGGHMREIYHKTINDALQLCQEGKFNPLVGRHFPLNKVNEAIEFASDRNSVGRVLIQMQQHSQL